VPLFQIVEVFIHGVSSRHGIIEVAVLDHHLRLHEAALRPSQFRPFVFGIAIIGALQILRAPTLHRRHPLRKVRRRSRAGNLVALHRQPEVLSRNLRGIRSSLPSPRGLSLSLRPRTLSLNLRLLRLLLRADEAADGPSHDNRYKNKSSHCQSSTLFAAVRSAL